MSESHAADEESEEVFVSSPDVSIESSEEKAKKSVHFNDRIFTTVFRSNSSILSRKNKTLKRTLRKKKKLSESESSDIESHEKSGSSTEDLKINSSTEVPSTPTTNNHELNGRKVMVVKPLLENGTTFTVTPVADSELEDKNSEGVEKSTRPGRQDSGYDSEESREVVEAVKDETSQITWQEVKSRNRRRKNRKPHTDQLRKESRVEAESVEEQGRKENDGSRTNELQQVISV